MIHVTDEQIQGGRRMSVFYTYLRSHWVVLSLLALTFLIVLAWIVPVRKIEVVNSVVLLYTLIVVLAYTDVTYGLAHQQDVQFRLMNRPWLYIDDVVYEAHPGGAKLVVLLLNSGNIPAEQEAVVDEIAVTPVSRDVTVTLKPGNTQVRHRSVVFPHISGKDTRYMVPLALSDDQRKCLHEYCSITISITLRYRALNSNKNEFPYSFSAVVNVPDFTVKTNVQSTYVDAVAAT